MKKILIAIAGENSPFKDFLEKYLIGHIGYSFKTQNFVDIKNLDSSKDNEVKKNTLMCYNSFYGTLLHKWIFVDSSKWNGTNNDMLLKIVKTKKRLSKFIFCNDSFH